MSSISLSGRKAILRSGAALCLAVLAGCSGNAAGDFVRSTGFGPTTAATPGFVASTRPKDVDFIPIQDPGPGRPTPAKTVDQVKAVEAEMDAVRERNAAAGAVAAQAGGTPPPDPALTPAKKRNPKASNATQSSN
jgi:hypothetical protein